MENQSTVRAGNAPATSGQRRDVHRSGIVDLGVALQQREGTIPAVEFLRSRNIAAAVIARVLDGPGRRRTLAG